MIGSGWDSTGVNAMNDSGEQRAGRTLRTGLLGMLLPLAISSTAQTVPATAPEALVMPAPIVETPAAQPRPAVSAAGTRVTPLPRGFDPAQFEYMAEQLVAGQRVPGMAMAIVQNGRILSARGYGITDVNQPRQIDAHTVFRLASLSKAFASATAGLLVNDGVLRWDSKVSDYVPGFQLSDANATAKLTVADVISQRVGLRAHNAFDNDIEANGEYYQVSHKLAGAALSCAPGECYSYQNVAFSLIGDVVFGATGSFYEQTVERRIFKPLGMNDASMGLAGIQASASWAKPHVRSRRGWASLMPKPTYYRMPPAAGVNASISDMAQWLIAQTGHRPDVLPAPLLATLHAPLISTPDQLRSGWRRERLSSANYALAWRVVDYAGHNVVFHAGAVQGYRGLVAMVPERDFGVAILWNSNSGLPSGMLPTVLDAALGLPAKQWLDVPTLGNDLMLARDSDDDDQDSGASSSRATAAPR